MQKRNHGSVLVLVLAVALVGACSKKSGPVKTEAPTPAQPTTAPTPAQPATAPTPAQPPPTAQPQPPATAPQDHAALASRPHLTKSAAEFAKDRSDFLAASMKAGGVGTQVAAAKVGGPDPHPMGLKGQPSPGDCSRCCVDGDCGNVCCFTPGGPESDPGPEPGHEPTDCGTCNRKSCIAACEGPPPSGWTNDQCVAFCNCCSHH